MKSSRVDTIMLPLSCELPAEPCVAVGEKISRAIEVMVSHNLDRIAVVRNRRAIGMIRLQDAFQEVGLEMPIRDEKGKGVKVSTGQANRGLSDDR